jgi:hypothetical protein
MTVKTSAQSTLMVAGLLLCCAGPSVAAGTAAAGTTLASPYASPYAMTIIAPNPRPRRPKMAAHAKPAKVALKPLAARKSPPADDADSPTAIPPSVANANAELTPTLPVGSAPTSAAAQAESPMVASTPVVSPDQPNDVNRAAQPSTLPTTAMMMASADTPVASGYDEPSNRDRTSLVGEIFIGIGVLLTLASAARMFMA